MSTDALDNLPIGRGAAAGVGAYLLGYLVTYLLHGSSIRDAFVTGVIEFFAGDPVAWKLVGWLFYNAHGVAATVPGLFGESTVNFVAEGEGLALTGLYVVVAVTLVAAGLAVAWGRGSVADGARAGATVVLGYLPLAVVGAFLFRVSVDDAVAGPTLVTAILLAGLFYPLVLGAVGGAVAGAVGGTDS
jgi:hypothetical protein